MFNFNLFYTNAREVQSEIEYDIIKHSVCFIFQGIAFILFGLFSLFTSIFLEELAILLIGVVLFLLGLVRTFSLCRTNAHWSVFFASISLIVAGYLMIINPKIDNYILSVLIAVLFLAIGISEIVFSMYIKFLCQHKWILVNGIISLTVAAIAIPAIQYYGIVFVGFVIGLNFCINGITIIETTRCVMKECQAKKQVKK